MTTALNLVHRLRDELADRRASHQAHAAMHRELATYTSPRDIDDLLDLIATDHNHTADAMRDVLAHNRYRVAMHRAS